MRAKITPSHPTNVTCEVTVDTDHMRSGQDAGSTHEGQEFTSPDIAPLGWCCHHMVQGCEGD